MQGRLGVRLHNQVVYFKADVIHDFGINRAKVGIGQDFVTERFAPTRFDLGFGAEKRVNHQHHVAVYGDLKYTRVIGSHINAVSGGAAAYEYSGEIGIRYVW